MPSKLRKAIGAVKDQTSIGLAKVSNTISCNLEVAIVKATTHEEVPVDDRYVTEVLLLTSSSKSYASACVNVLAKRIGRTRNWIVALKSLTLIFKIFQNGDPYFPQEILQAMKRGAKLINLTNFRDDSQSSPWDYTAFVRTYALYLDERLDCCLMGKLRLLRRRSSEPVELKPPVLLDQIMYWQRLLDRALATRPTGLAKNNRLVQISLYSIVKESFDLYRDISDGLSILLDNYFHLQHRFCVEAFHTSGKAAKQFEELDGFYDLCRSLGVGRKSDYPTVQKISTKILETLEEFLKDHQASKIPIRVPPSQLPPPVKQISNSDDKPRQDSKGDERLADPIEVLMDVNEPEQKNSRNENQQQQQQSGWELVLVESANDMTKRVNYSVAGGFDSMIQENLFDQLSLCHPQGYNPFLQVNNGSEPSIVWPPILPLPPPPTFCVNKPNQEAIASQLEEDPFALSLSVAPQPQKPMVEMSDTSMNPQVMLQEQQLWIKNQSKIIARTTREVTKNRQAT